MHGAAALPKARLQTYTTAPLAFHTAPTSPLHCLRPPPAGAIGTSSREARCHTPSQPQRPQRAVYWPRFLPSFLTHHHPFLPLTRVAVAADATPLVSQRQHQQARLTRAGLKPCFSLYFTSQGWLCIDYSHGGQFVVLRVHGQHGWLLLLLLLLPLPFTRYVTCFSLVSGSSAVYSCNGSTRSMKPQPMKRYNGTWWRICAVGSRLPLNSFVLISPSDIFQEELQQLHDLQVLVSFFHKKNRNLLT